MSIRNYKTYIYFCIAALLLSTLILSGCKRSKSAASNQGVAEASTVQPVEVTTSQAVSRNVPMFLQVTGSFSADEASDVAPQISGQVVATPVDVGAFVKQGQVIARLDDRDARLRLQQLSAAERQAESALRQAEAKLGLDKNGQFNASAVPEVIAARQNYEAAEAQAKLAETNARRYENLVASGDVSQIVADQYRTQADTARAQANAAKKQYEVAINTARQNNQGIAVAQAALEAARAQVAIAKKALADTTIVAPLSGFVSDRPVAVGEYVTTQSKIATILKSNPIKLKLQLPEGEASTAHIGASVIATVAAFPDQEFSGIVTAVNPALDAASRTITAEVDIKNPDNKLKAGMFASARLIQHGGGEGIFIPTTAVMKEANETSVRIYVVEGDTARLRVAQTGETQGDMVRILKGMKSGETVATSNLDLLYDGALIRQK
ncbi:MAG: efflux RND transporter periplasmic adaptor subunit [Acidobacteriota bacterium]